MLLHGAHPAADGVLVRLVAGQVHHGKHARIVPGVVHKVRHSIALGVKGGFVHTFAVQIIGLVAVLVLHLRIIHHRELLSLEPKDPRGRRIHRLALPPIGIEAQVRLFAAFAQNIKLGVLGRFLIICKGLANLIPGKNALGDAAVPVVHPQAVYRHIDQSLLPGPVVLLRLFHLAAIDGEQLLVAVAVKINLFHHGQAVYIADTALGLVGSRAVLTVQIVYHIVVGLLFQRGVRQAGLDLRRGLGVEFLHGRGHRIHQHLRPGLPNTGQLQPLKILGIGLVILGKHAGIYIILAAAGLFELLAPHGIQGHFRGFLRVAHPHLIAAPGVVQYHPAAQLAIAGGIAGVGGVELAEVLAVKAPNIKKIQALFQITDQQFVPTVAVKIHPPQIRHAGHSCHFLAVALVHRLPAASAVLGDIIGAHLPRLIAKTLVPLALVVQGHGKGDNGNHHCQHKQRHRQPLQRSPAQVGIVPQFFYNFFVPAHRAAQLGAVHLQGSNQLSQAHLRRRLRLFFLVVKVIIRLHGATSLR